MKRITVLVNKDFEYAGFIEGLRDTVQVYAGTNGRDAEVRLSNLTVDIYCIQHLFPEGENSSNSEVKYNLLMKLFESHQFRLSECDAVFSVSSAESTEICQRDAESRNGCVYVGNRFFLSDQSKCDPTTQSHLRIDPDGSWLFYEPPVSQELYDVLNVLKMPLRPAFNKSAEELRCFADDSHVCVGVANVMDYTCYHQADECVYFNYWNTQHEDYTPVSIETTHGVVVMALRHVCGGLDLTPPVNFISPIVDRYLKFEEDVDGKYGKQNYICSYNGGVVTGHMLKILNENM